MSQRYEIIEDAFLPGWLLGPDKQVASAGEVVYEFHGATYGCISPQGVACSREDGVGPFFEVAHTNLRSVISTA